LTLYAFIATMLLPGTKLIVISNNYIFIKLIKQTQLIKLHKLDLLDKTEYSHTLHVIKVLTLNIQTTLQLDKQLKHTQQPNATIKMDIIPHNLLVNKYTSCILSLSCLYHLKTTIKEIYQNYQLPPLKKSEQDLELNKHFY
ncbi:15623_t:CDS:1, partial [Gigaspora margarita]